MCQQVTCRRCGKPTYAGCGAHIEQVLGHVPRDQRCRCREEASAAAGGSSGKGPGGVAGWLKSLIR